MINLDKNFFEFINTEEKAYWLGFIWADGHVSQKAPWFLVVQIKDRDHMEKLCKALSYDGTIKAVHGSGYNPNAIHYRVAFCRRKLCDDLNNLGRNSNKDTLPDIDPSLMGHFLRGYFDGDGSVIPTTTVIKGVPYTYLRASIIAEIGLAKNIQQFLLSNNITSVLNDSRTEYMKYISVTGGNNMRRLHSLMYENHTVCLTRKNVLWHNLYGAHGEKSLS